MAEPQGAGKGGGLLFLAVVLFVGYLVVTSVLGILKWLLGTAFLVVAAAIVVSLLSRR